LEQISKEANKALPKAIDAETEIISISVPSDTMFNYDYRLVDQSFGAIKKEEFEAIVSPIALSNACKSEKVKEMFLRKGVTLRSSYYDKDRNLITSIDIKPSDCGL